MGSPDLVENLRVDQARRGNLALFRHIDPPAENLAPRRTAETKPLWWNFKFAAYPFGQVHEVYGAAELVGYQLTY
jgi:hypothetical protein